jgi:hypothetical protein
MKLLHRSKPLLWRRREILSILAVLGGMRAAGQDARRMQWNKIRYQGGTVEAKVNPFDWNTTLTLTVDALELDFAGREKREIPLERIGVVSHGQAAYRRVARHSSASVLVTPIPLFGLLRKNKDQLVSIEFREKDGATGIVLLSVRKQDLAARKPVEEAP